MSTKIFFFIIPFLSPCYSFGQSTILENDSTKNKLEEVIITGTKTERVLSSLPLNVSIIKKSEIEKKMNQYWKSKFEIMLKKDCLKTKKENIILIGLKY